MVVFAIQAPKLWLHYTLQQSMGGLCMCDVEEDLVLFNQCALELESGFCFLRSISVNGL